MLQTQCLTKTFYDHLKLHVFLASNFYSTVYLMCSCYIWLCVFFTIPMGLLLFRVSSVPFVFVIPNSI